MNLGVVGLDGIGWKLKTVKSERGTERRKEEGWLLALPAPWHFGSSSS